MSKKAFRCILDGQQEEAVAFCGFMEKKAGLPAPITALEKTQRLLQRMAFAYLCQDYLHVVHGYYASEDYDLHAEEVGLRKHASRVHYLAGLASIEWEGEKTDNYTGIDEELLVLLIFHYKEWWGKVIRQHYPNEIACMNLFSEQLDISGGSEDKAFGFVGDLV